MNTKEEIRQALLAYYEIDIDNCNMRQIDWIEELSNCMLDAGYKNKFLKEYEDYLNTLKA
jgi:hypothetical protein